MNKIKDCNKGLFIAFEFEVNNECTLVSESNGIIKKIKTQISTFEKHGYKIDFWNPYSGRKHSIRRFTRRLPFYFLNTWKFDERKINDYDFIYIRKAWFMDGDLINFLRKVKNISPSMKVLLEIPTYPYDQEGKKMNMLPLIWKDKYWRNKLKYYVDKIVTYSNDESIFGVETICISNAIDINSINLRKVKIKNENVISLIAVSSLYYWHGYDRVIKGLGKYYQSKGNEDPLVYFHIVGDGNETDYYKKLIKEMNLSNYVIMHGNLSGQLLDEVYDNSDIGLDSMGRHRSGVNFNSSLKSKEYCAKGLPIVSGVCTELDNATDFMYYMRVPADDSEINIYHIIDFYKKMKVTGSVNTEIREYASKYFDYYIAMNPIIKYVKYRET